MIGEGELDVPPAASVDPEGLEILRVWIANQNQHVIVRAYVWDDPAAWGMMLADIARHVSNAYARDAGHDREETLKRIRDMFEIEMTHPTENFTPRGIEP